MLVLSIREGELLHIGGSVHITAIKTSSGRVKLGVVAPEDVAVLRDKVIMRRQEAAKLLAPSEEEKLCIPA